MQPPPAAHSVLIRPLAKLRLEYRIEPPVDQDVEHAHRLVLTVAPGMVGAALDHDIAQRDHGTRGWGDRVTKFSALSCAVFNSTGSEDLAALQLAHEGVSREHADRPVDQPNRFELVVNMKTAKALVITVSRMILVRVDRLVE